MKPEIEQQLIAHLEAVQLQIWIFGAVTALLFLGVTYLARSNWERVEKVLEANTKMIQIHDKDLAVIKSTQGIGEHLEKAAETISEAIREGRERRSRL